MSCRTFRIRVGSMTCLACLACGFAEAQPDPEVLWEAFIEHPSRAGGRCVLVASDGGYAIVGSGIARPLASSDVWLARLDAMGRLLWERSYGGDGSEEGGAAVETAAGGYAICGTTTSYSPPSDEDPEDVFLLETAADGTIQWTRSFGTSGADFGHGITSCRNGGYAIAAGLNHHAALIRTDEDGEVVWEKVFDSGTAWSVVETSDGGYLLAGDTFVEERSREPFILKTNALGEAVWTRFLGGPDYDEHCHAVEVSTGGFIATGSLQTGAELRRQVHLTRTDAAGEVLWQKLFGGPWQDHGLSVVETRDGGFLLAGLADSGPVDSHGLVLKTDALGALEWEKKLGGTGSDILYSAVETPDGGAIAAGDSSPLFSGIRPAALHVVRLGPASMAPTEQVLLPTSQRAGALAEVPVRIRSQEDVNAFSFEISHEGENADVIAHSEGPDLASIGGADFLVVESAPEACPGGETVVSVTAVVNFIEPSLSLPAGPTLDVLRLWYRARNVTEVPLRFGCPGEPAEATPTDARGGRLLFTSLPYVRGDVNADGVVDISDPVSLTRFLYAGASVPCLAACDVDLSSGGPPEERVNLTDAVYLLGFLFTQGSAPPDPFPDCGATLFDLACDEFPPCP